MNAFIAGTVCMAYVVAALFFLRFWAETRDRLFAMFGIAFAVLGANRILLSFLQEPHEARTWLYLMRLLAFVSILGAILDKNRGHRA